MTPPNGGIHPRPSDDLLLSFSAEQRELRRFVTDARTHPENYPPHGNSAKAIMPPGVPDFQHSGALTNIASAHSIFLTGVDKDWVNADKNMHRGPDGTLVWEPGQPMDQAGFHTWRTENVAVGFDTAEKVVRFWMQDDEVWEWGHRNAILFDDWFDPGDIREAGFGYARGGPWTHYWTLDMGRKTGPF
ncbi:CAP domain-containing protein (plasmid) [Streptomyces sp. NBC_00161]|uniref:CAP domain-containing protein n=1 Tax=Streptomyces sp. NBC_00161 TaxID=2975671 RepID=UPI0032469164